MSWFRRGSGPGGHDLSSSPAPSPSRGRSLPPGMDNQPQFSTPKVNHLIGSRGVHGSLGHDTDRPNLGASPIARRALHLEVDPETCLEVYRTHWCQAKAVMMKSSIPLAVSPKIRRSTQEEVESVLRYIDQMALLLVEEEPHEGGQGPILEYMLTEDILETLFTWSLQTSEYTDQVKLHQLKMYDLLISQSLQQLLIHKPFIRPLLKLLGSCQDHPWQDIEHFLVLILHQLCVCVMQYRHLLELLFDASPDQGPAKFLIFSILIMYIHREGDIGQQARDALLLIMSLSSVQEGIGQYIANNSDFCPVLATGLSGLYSSLLRKLAYPSDDWYQLTSEDIVNMPDLVMFLNSLDFCNAVVQVAHPLVRDQLLLFIYNGFLLPVLGPALHQDLLKLPVSLLESYFASSMEEVIAATAYLDLFMRRITEPALMHTFLRFILTAQHDDINILDSLITRINSNSRLCMVTLSLFKTLIDLNCEDVMFQLVFKYLIPCNHVMVSQRRAIKDIDLYSLTAEKILSLRPACCLVEPAEGSTEPLRTAVDNISNSSSSPHSSPGSPILTPSPHTTAHGRKFRQFLLRRSPAVHTQCVSGNHAHTPIRSSSPDSFSVSSTRPSSVGSSFNRRQQVGGAVNIDTSYLDYLKAVRLEIEQCSAACRCWRLPYDGNNPPMDSLIDGHITKTKNSALNMESTSNSAAVETNEILPNECNLDIPKSVCDIPDNNITPYLNSDMKSSEPNSAGTKSSRTDSMATDVDSAFSGSNQAHSPSSSSPRVTHDSVLSDNFNNADFGAFLLMLKRVQTPVELSSSLDESFSEIDKIVNRWKDVHPAIVADIAKSSYSSVNADNNVEKSDVSTPVVLSNGFSGIKGLNGLAVKNDEESACIINGDQTSLKWTTHPLITPLKHSNSQTPNVGPFLTTLLTRLDQMLQNTLYVNLLLTGVISRLACYPQPLLRSFLLNHTLVFQPTVKSLLQVLGSVKQKVDCFSLTVSNFEDMLLKARHFLQWREEMYLHSIGEPSNRRESSFPFPVALVSDKPSNDLESQRGEKKSAIRELFRRNQPPKKLLLDRKSAKYVNHRQGNSDSQDLFAEQLESLKIKNAVYCAIVLDEALKEFAAISQEHAVACLAEL